MEGPEKSVSCGWRKVWGKMKRVPGSQPHLPACGGERKVWGARAMLKMGNVAKGHVKKWVCSTHFMLEVKTSGISSVCHPLGAGEYPKHLEQCLVHKGAR